LTIQTTRLKFSGVDSEPQEDANPMPPDSRDVTDAELSVLQVLWEHGQATIRQLTNILYPGGKAAHYGTVQKLLERLEEKGHVTRDRTPWPHVFAPAVERETIIGLRLRDTAEKLCGGSMTPLLLHLLKAEQLSDKERQQLWAFLDQLREDSSGKDAGS
jgi:predicted transcriptional regulator